MAPSQRMFHLLLVSLLLVTCAARRQIDCTRFVYAPSCRGVSAKRGGGPLSVRGSTELNDALTDSLLRAADSKEERDTEKNWRQWSRLSRVLRLLSQSKRGADSLEQLLPLQ